MTSEQINIGTALCEVARWRALETLYQYQRQLSARRDALARVKRELIALRIRQLEALDAPEPEHG